MLLDICLDESDLKQQSIQKFCILEIYSSGIKLSKTCDWDKIKKIFIFSHCVSISIIRKDMQQTCSCAQGKDLNWTFFKAFQVFPIVLLWICCTTMFAWKVGKQSILAFPDMSLNDLRFDWKSKEERWVLLPWLDFLMWMA